MSFWSNLIEPHRQYRWIMTIGGNGFGGPVQFALKKASRPTIKISEVTHKYLNHFYYYPGRVEWEPITVTFASAPVEVDSANTSRGTKYTNDSLIAALVASGYMYPAPGTEGIVPNTHLKTISKQRAVGAVTSGMTATSATNISIQMLDADGATSAETTWYLFNPFFTDVKFDSLEYGSEEILNLDCTIRYDFATLGLTTPDELVL